MSPLGIRLSILENFTFVDIQKAAERIQPYVVRTPLLNSPMLDSLGGCNVFVKAENLQKTGSFKFRGALNKILSLDAASLRTGVITYSVGNHGQRLAAAAKMAGCPAVIVLPDTAPAIKVDSCRWWGAEVVLYNPQNQNRAEVTAELVDQRGMTFISPFDDHDVMAGQGTAGLELADQLQEQGVPPDAILVNCSSVAFPPG